MATPWCEGCPFQSTRNRGCDGRSREAIAAGLDFLQAGDIGSGFVQPLQQARQAAVDAVHVEGGDLRGRGSNSGIAVTGDLRGEDEAATRPLGVGSGPSSRARLATAPLAPAWRRRSQRLATTVVQRSGIV